WGGGGIALGGRGGRTRGDFGDRSRGLRVWSTGLEVRRHIFPGVCSARGMGGPIGAELWGAELWGAELWGAELWGAERPPSEPESRIDREGGEMARLTTLQKVERTVKLLLGMRIPRVAQQLAPYGFGRATLEDGRARVVALGVASV